MIRTSRLYEYKAKSNTYVILVDRLWPRGISKENKVWDEWMKSIAPSNELRKWFGHDPEKWEEFRIRYHEELKFHKVEIDRIKELEQQYGTVHLLYTSKNIEYNHTRVIMELLH